MLKRVIRDFWKIKSDLNTRLQVSLFNYFLEKNNVFRSLIPILQLLNTVLILPT